MALLSAWSFLQCTTPFSPNNAKWNNEWKGAYPNIAERELEGGIKRERERALVGARPGLAKVCTGQLTDCLPFEFAVKPLTVNIEGANQPLSAGKRYDLVCTTSGSRPSALVTWLRDDQELLHSKDTVSTAYTVEIDNSPLSRRHRARIQTPLPVRAFI